MEKLYRELNARSIAFKPHVWLGEEWFTPDGVAGFAIPFYLAHPRLMKLERAQMLEVEGASEGECMRILRHEAAHALGNAFRLHSRRSWKDIFGSYRVDYPEWYQPQPGSRDYVLNLDAWYGQAHPAEDFAETFAVWLKPGNNWRRQYEGWGALRKLEYVDSLMKDRFGLGGEAGVAAGPVGRNAGAGTDALMHAAMLSYSRSRGLFAGAALKGLVIKPEDDLNLAVYGKTAEELLKESAEGDATPELEAFPRALNRYTVKS